MKFLLKGVSGLLTIGCAAGLTNLEQGIAEDMRITVETHQLCERSTELAGAGTQMAPLFISTDSRAIDRIRTGLLGVSENFDPQAEVQQALSSAEREVKSLNCKVFEPRKDEIVSAVNNLGAITERLADQARLSRDIAEEMLAEIKEQRLLETFDNCAKAGVGVKNDRSGCTMGSLPRFAARMQNSRSLGILTREIPNQLDQLQENVRNLHGHVRDLDQLLRAEKLGAHCNTESVIKVLGELKFLEREVTAWGGLLRDANDWVTRLGVLRSEPEQAAFQLASIVASSQSDAVADILLTWLQRSVRRIDLAIEKLDQEAYGAASSLVSLGLSTGVVERTSCKVASEAKRFLNQAGLQESALGARLCQSVTTNSPEYPPSPILTRAFLGMIRASNGVTCEQLDSSNDAAVSFYPNLSEEDASHSPLLAYDLDVQARATWYARVQTADRNISRLLNPNQYNLGSMPKREDIARGLEAAALLVEYRERALLADANVTPVRRFEMRRSMILNGFASLNRDVRLSICNEQVRAEESGQTDRIVAVPPACIAVAASSTSVADASLVLATERVAAELCELNNRVEQYTVLEGVCNAVRDRSVGIGLGCVNSGASALLYSSSNLDKGDFPSKESKVGGGEVYKALELIAERLSGHVAGVDDGSPMSQLKVTFVGHASEQFNGSTEKWVTCLKSPGDCKGNGGVDKLWTWAQEPNNSIDVASVGNLQDKAAKLEEMPADQRAADKRELANKFIAWLRAVGAAQAFSKICSQVSCEVQIGGVWNPGDKQAETVQGVVVRAGLKGRASQCRGGVQP